MKNTQPRPIQPGSRLSVRAVHDPTCPILLESRLTLDKALDLHRLIRSLRRSTQRCPTCPNNAECPTLCYFAHALDASQHLLHLIGEQA